jgi:hypothetical protein
MALNLPLPRSPRTAVFRALVKLLHNDLVLRNVLKDGALRSWSGTSHDSMEFTFSIAPAIRLTPTNGPEQFWSPNAQVGDLLINCEMIIAGTNVDDVQNLWWGIEKAIYPADQTKAVAHQQTLQAAGAHSGLVLFSQPAFDPTPESKFFAAMGQMRIAVRLQFN